MLAPLVKEGMVHPFCSSSTHGQAGRQSWGSSRTRAVPLLHVSHLCPAPGRSIVMRRKGMHHDSGKLCWNSERAGNVRSHDPRERFGNGASKLLGARLAKHALFVVVHPSECGELVPCRLPSPLASVACGSLINHDGLAKIRAEHGYPPFPVPSTWGDGASQCR